MSSQTSIEWTDATWNPVTGCTKSSPGCQHCYAERLAMRLKAMGLKHYSRGFEVVLHPEVLEVPLHWKKPRHIFVNSMSDLFHETVPEDFIQEVFKVVRKAKWHNYQILTKRAERLVQLDSNIKWPSNVWMGVSVENIRYTYRIDLLKKTHAQVKFISFEPLLGDVGTLNLSGIDWCVVGGESGPGARPMKPEWVTNIRDQCIKNNVPFFFKQWGGTNKKKAGRLLEGRIWDEMPGSNKT